MSVNIGSMLLKLGVSFLAGMIIGIERELEHKPAGLRTIVLVCLGSTVFIMIGLELVAQGASVDRVVAGVITGVGFLGAGAIIQARGHIQGLTTAAAIWVASGIGLATGAGYYVLVVVVVVIVLIVLRVLNLIEKALLNKQSQ
jgi:putative Mg2+ transporter-C (MgtC) family protein